MFIRLGVGSKKVRSRNFCSLDTTQINSLFVDEGKFYEFNLDSSS